MEEFGFSAVRFTADNLRQLVSLHFGLQRRNWLLSRSFGSGGIQANVMGLSSGGIQGGIWSTLLARNLA